MTRGIIYVMWNELFPDLVKIGVTQGSTAKDVEKRRRELSHGENMPQPFEAKFAICVNNYNKIEPLIHKALNKLRHNSHREFFKLSIEEAICLLRTYTVSGDAEEIAIDTVFLVKDKKAIQKVRKQRSKITFKELGLKQGTVLHFVGNPKYTVKTHNDSRIVMMPDGTTDTISKAAKKYRNTINPNNDVKGLPDGATDFMYNGKTLIELALKNKILK